ncbi:MAG TPA: carbamoyltransferase HypF [Acidobacteriaceae bacterium]
MATTPAASARRKHIEVRGIVQGVGFRPFVYKLAHSLGLTGYVFNSSSGVTIEIEGGEVEVDEFVETLRGEPPQLAEIAGMVVSDVATLRDTGFSIRKSHEERGGFSLISPDAGTCDACWRDFGDPLNRRFGYPFTNCTHCGPRYTIIQDIPYDRATTTMSCFTMCAACAAEYADPNDRRFHAQPNACGVCGPSLELVDRGTSLDNCSFTDRDSLTTIRKARALLRAGNILAVKGLGGFLLACDAANDAAVAELRRRKRRPDKPFALMARDVADVRKLCGVSAEDEEALLDVRRPIVVLPRLATANVSAGVAPGNDTLGVMLPYTPLHYLLFSDSPDTASEFTSLVMTSGNLSEEPIVVSNAEAMRQLENVADWFLLHNRDIAMRVDDSVVRTFEGRERVLRRSRGFVPQTIDLGIEMDEVLAFGGELKNTFCLTKGRYAILSQHIGDLENYETMQFFEETLARMKHLFRVSPQAVAYDMHPGYWSTRLALSSPIERKIAVQHHHAHIASCMAENHLHGNVIGVAFDGTGFGTDGKIWGGEFMVADFSSFTRRAHLRYVPLPGGDAAVRQPWRMALSYLRDAFGQNIPAAMTRFPGVTEKQLDLVDTMLARRIQTVETSSCGRLFDAVAALLGLASEVTFEGQAAIALETAAVRASKNSRRLDAELYPFDVHAASPMILDLRATIAAIAGDVAQSRLAEEISAKFHNTLAAAIVEVCVRIRESDGLTRICLSGGTFQNHCLLERTIVQLRRRGFDVFLHTLVPANDGGIALGQAVIANELLQRDR